MREKLSLPIGIRGPFGSAKAPPAARSDNALRKERGGRRTRIRAEPPARALRGGRDGPTRGHCAAGGTDQPAGVVRKKGAERPRRAEILFLRSLALRRAFIAPCRSRQKGSRRPSRGAGGRSRPVRRVWAHKKKRSRSSVFLLSVYSLEPVSISEPMIIFWKIANRMMTGRTHMTAAAMTGPWF